VIFIQLNTQVVGASPYRSSCYLDTETLSSQIINTMLPAAGGESVDSTIYLRNLALLVCFALPDLD
jgi:hypothetical protein